jgi:hypothetical protein
MYYLIDKNLKIIFGLSAKCGCTHIKNIYFFLLNNEFFKGDNIHIVCIPQKLPNDIENYITIIISRNPFKKIVSGFLDKYSEHGEFRRLWKVSNLTFSNFIDELIKNDWKMIDCHHFTQQTSEDFDKSNIMRSKIIKCYDIENIDYNYIEKLYNKEIPLTLKNFKGSHSRQKKDTFFNEYVYNLNIDEYINSNVDIKYFYNEKLKKDIINFYKNDFDFFKEFGFDYI